MDGMVTEGSFYESKETFNSLYMMLGLRIWQ